MSCTWACSAWVEFVVRLIRRRLQGCKGDVLKGFVCGRLTVAALWACGFSGATFAADGEKSTDNAALFGAREAIQAPALSPDGKMLLYMVANGDTGTSLAVVPTDGSKPPKSVLFADGKPLHLKNCGWADNRRILCTAVGIFGKETDLSTASRLVAVDADGEHRQGTLGQTKLPTDDMDRQFGSHVIDWLHGDTGDVLVETWRDVSRLNTRTFMTKPLAYKNSLNEFYFSDGNGNLRLKYERNYFGRGTLMKTGEFSYLLKDGGHWQTLSRIADDGPGLRPIAIDAVHNSAYCLDKKDGRDALFRVALDGSLKTELIYADPTRDVDKIITAGRDHRLIGVSFDDDLQKTVYLDHDYAVLSGQLSKALHDVPIVSFEGSDATESKIIVFAGSSADAGRFYIYDRHTRHLDEIGPVRLNLEGKALSAKIAVSYRAADGTNVPAFLTFPLRGGKTGLPAIVMPHGGPSSHDTFGFDWLVQFYAAQGYAVLQPEYRGSTGYGDAWQVRNGYRSWRTSISDVLDAGRWLVAQGIADPARLAIVGWSYGGYAALQAQVVDPDLFKAVVAIAPVTDLWNLTRAAAGYTDSALVRDFVGGASEAEAGSPDRHVGSFKAPVLLFHGTSDLNVPVSHSRTMDAKLLAAGKKSELIIYPGLDHGLPDGQVRADMLRRSDGFLREALRTTH